MTAPADVVEAIATDLANELRRHGDVTATYPIASMDGPDPLTGTPIVGIASFLVESGRAGESTSVTVTFRPRLPSHVAFEVVGEGDAFGGFCLREHLHRRVADAIADSERAPLRRAC